MSKNADDDGPPYEPDDLRSLFEEEYPGGWKAHCRDWDDQVRAEKELLARSPWRRLEKRIEQLAHEAGIEPELARRLVEDRLAVEIAEAIAQEFRLEIGVWPAPHPVSQANHQSGQAQVEEPRVATPYLNVVQAAAYLRKTPKAIYGLIERGRLRKMPGSHVCLFTRDMLDEFLRGETTNGRSLRPRRRAKG